ncbi:MAG: DUF481 domain-containing protein [Terracidiphilus sp.]
MLFSAAMSVGVLSRSTEAWASSRQKTDVVYMQNGDRITGEIESLEKGSLSVKPYYVSSSIALDWTKVDHLESSQLFLVVDPNGTSYLGTFGRSAEKNMLHILGPDGAALPHDSVIEISEIGSTFVKRMRGNIDAGLSATASNQQNDLTVQAGLTYQSEKQIYSFSSSSQFATQEKTEDTNETTVKSAVFHQLKDSNWYVGAIANFLSSSEQQIDLQSTLGAALSKRIIFTNKTDLTAIGGLGYTRLRNPSGAESTASKNSLDSAFAVQYSTFRFDSTTFDTAVWVYPSITSPGHVRVTLNQNVYYKFLGDFYIRFSFYNNYDNRPVVGAPANNLGGSTSVGWSFH